MALEDGNTPQFTFDLFTRSLTGSGVDVPRLPGRPARLYTVLDTTPDKFLSHAALVDLFTVGKPDNTIKVQVKRLRQFLGDGEKEVVRTVQDAGYKLNADTQYQYRGDPVELVSPNQDEPVAEWYIDWARSIIQQSIREPMHLSTVRLQTLGLLAQAFPNALTAARYESIMGPGFQSDRYVHEVRILRKFSALSGLIETHRGESEYQLTAAVSFIVNGLLFLTPRLTQGR